MMCKENNIEKFAGVIGQAIDHNSFLGDDRMEEINMQGIAKELIEKGYNRQIEGEWIYHECVSSYNGAKSGYSCSCCSAFVDENIFDMDEFHKGYCGNCGAKLKDGEQG